MLTYLPPFFSWPGRDFLFGELLLVCHEVGALEEEHVVGGNEARAAGGPLLGLLRTPAVPSKSDAKI